MPSCKFIIDAQGALCFVTFFIINIEQNIVWFISDRQQPYKQPYEKMIANLRKLSQQTVPLSRLSVINFGKSSENREFLFYFF